MSHSSVLDSRPPLVLADFFANTRLRNALLVVGGAALTGLAAQIAFPVPGSPVPVTGQTFAALVVGSSLGMRRGVVSMLLYLGAGMVGVPWFAEGSSGFAMPTLGYIIGFVVAAAVVGALATRGADRSPIKMAGAMLAGNLAIYAVALPYLAFSLHIGLSDAFDLGMRNYLFGDLLKVALAAGCLPAVWQLIQRKH
ncbi:biotin transporter BioY [Flexivirga alba]|uniref:Biotin transporter n=1 Tax=Flexivirga alba TaxID=702742 RepID=A0ABW2AKJ3_9MICO